MLANYSILTQGLWPCNETFQVPVAFTTGVSSRYSQSACSTIIARATYLRITFDIKGTARTGKAADAEQLHRYSADEDCCRCTRLIKIMID